MELKNLYRLIVQCLHAGSMDKTIERLQGNLSEEIRKAGIYA